MTSQRGSDEWIEGYDAARKECDEQERPALVNPYPVGTDAYEGYEAAVYYFTGVQR